MLYLQRGSVLVPEVLGCGEHFCDSGGIWGVFQVSVHLAAGILGYVQAGQAHLESRPACGLERG